jgi:glycine oxidase
MADTTEVVIVGGGAAGCSVAYFLALAGVKSTIIEREGVASQASGFSAGGLNPLQGTGIPGPLSEVAMESYLLHQDLFPTLNETTGVDYEWRIISLIKAAFEQEDLPELQETFDTFTAAEGFGAEMVDPAQLQDLEPRISSAVAKAVVARGNVSLDSYKYTLALVQAAEKMGTSLRSGTVQGIERSNGRVTGVRIDGGVLHCDTLVMATGPWTRIAEPWLGAYVPVDPLKGEILRMELPGGPLGYDISGGGGSLHPKPDGLVWCGTTEEWRGYDKSTTESARQYIVKGAVKLLPEMAQARLVLHTACLRPVTPDWLPIIGRTPGLDNAYLATGAGKKGILLSPAIGKAIADQITQGGTELSVGEFDPARFASPLA